MPYRNAAIVRKNLSTDLLPQSLSDKQRFMKFAELFEHFSNTGEFDPAEDVPFRANMNSISAGTTTIGRCSGTFRTVRRERRQIIATTEELYCLARNVEPHDAVLRHHGREFTLRPGSLTLLRLDEPFLGADGTSHKRFTNINFPVAALRAMTGHIDDLIGCELAPGGALSLAMDYSEMLLNHADAVDQAGVAIASHVIDLISIGLEARTESAYMARGRGLREVRFQTVLMILMRRFTESDFSTRKLAAAANLSERYVSELLYDAGASFHERINELRLRKALEMLAQPGPLRISDVAFACGFNDLSYFNRCFRRRFGLTPTAARGR